AVSNMVVELAPQDEWRQIFDETWRLMRDFYWDANMGGVDWKAQRDKYRALLPRLGTRDELNDLLGELIGELATSHTYIFGGDSGTELPQITTGLLGIDAVRKGGGFESQRILERMRRKVIAVFHARGGSTTTYPVRSVDGPFVVLTNEYAGSDGDIFPTVVQLDKLAPVIGMRSWGGVVGIRGDKPL